MAATPAFLIVPVGEEIRKMAALIGYYSSCCVSKLTSTDELVPRSDTRGTGVIEPSS